MKNGLLLFATILALSAGPARAGDTTPPPVGPGHEVEHWMRAPRIHMATGLAFRPYRAIAACPPGTKPEVNDWPQAGDMTCEPTDETLPPPYGVEVPRVYLPVDRAAVPGSEPLREVARCPRGTRPTVRGEGAYTYFLCDRDHAIVSWGAEPPEGQSPRINIPNNDPFRPYRTVSTCPPGKFPVILDWPRPGDMGCGPF